jgi:hypothetical protein
MGSDFTSRYAKTVHKASTQPIEGLLETTGRSGVPGVSSRHFFQDAAVQLPYGQYFCCLLVRNVDVERGLHLQKQFH